jgi:hypothetical protein
MSKPAFVRTMTDAQWRNATTHEKALHVARGKVGVRGEWGHGRGFWVNQFLASVGLSPGYNWCAAFVRWCLLQAGAPANRLPNARQSAGVWAWRNWGRETLRLKRNNPERGDLFFWINPNGTGHIGFIAEVFRDNNGNWASLRTLEGNTNAAGSRTGNAVAEQRRSRALLQSKHDFGFVSLRGL